MAKMASHAIFQYNVLAIDDTHNTWTNICVKMIIIRLIDPRDEKIQNPEEIEVERTKTEVICTHRLNRREANYTYRCNGLREDSVSRVHRMNRREAE